jgi:hypothetical protein
MPRYLNLDHFEKADRLSAHLYEAIHFPGDEVKTSGIYACEACGRETYARANESLPPESDCGSHKNPSAQSGEVKWRLVAATKDGCVDHVVPHIEEEK